MSGETFERLKKLISDLRTRNTRDEPAADVEENLYKELSHVYKSDVENDAQDALGVVIERYSNLSERKQYIQYKRLTAVYDRNMYNKFLVPIWAAATSADRSEGYILYPKLTPLKKVLTDLKGAGLQPEVYCDNLKEVLRLCFAPIALAIDALHTPVLNKRTRYHHKDVCIDNIYMSVTKGKDSSDQETVAYDDARLKLTKLSREAQKLMSEADEVPAFKPLLGEYYHHKEVACGGSVYDIKHDWYSFGVFISEVVHLVLSEPGETTSHQVEDYTDISYLTSLIQASEEMASIQPLLYQYLDISAKCLKLEIDKAEQLSYEVPPEMRHRQASTLYFEYSVSTCTAQLLWMYEDLRSRQSTSAGDVCQACLLHSKGLCYRHCDISATYTDICVISPK